MRDIKTFLQMNGRLYTILNKKQRFKMLGLFLIITVGAVFELLGVSSMMPLMEAILDPSELMKNKYFSLFFQQFGIDTDYEIIIFVGIGIVLIYLIKNVFLAFSLYLQAAYGNNTRRELAVLMLKSYMEQPYAFFTNSRSGDIMRGVTGDISGVYEVIINIFKFMSEFLTVILVAIFLIVTDWVMALGVVWAGIICMIVIILGLKRKLSKLADIFREASSEMNKWIVQSISGIKDIMVFGRQKYFIDGYDGAHKNCNTANTNYTFACGLPERIIEAFCVSGIIITVLVRLGMGVDAGVFVPQMAVFAMAAFRILPSISRLTGYITAFIYYRPSVDAAYENITTARMFLEEKSRIVSAEDVENNIIFNDEIVIKEINWKYEDGKEQLFSNLSMSIKKGQIIGIVGESGAGKSTLSDILLRLYKPQAGVILMDNIDIDTIPETWTKTTCYVPQTVFLMDDTIKSNIAFGLDYVDEDKIWEVLDKASIGDFVRKLPNKLDTIVGERGVKFSGGQRQRFAIARALYANPQILILDEATSALDNETEFSVMDAIDSLGGIITLIIIAHRITTLKNCDVIYEIVDGKAVERDKKEILKI